MRRIVYSILCVAALYSVASCYDDSQLRADIVYLKDKVAKLESDVNGNTSAIAALAAAAEGAVTITSVTQTENGYVISFSNGQTATLTNGQDGQNGSNGQNGQNGANGLDAPVLGVLNEGGVLYWTLGGEALTVDGNKLPVTGADGKTPQFKIENNIWKVSFDGQSWEDVPVTGAENDEEFSMSETEFEYVFTWGTTEIKIQKESAFGITVSSETLELKPAMVLTFTYEVFGADETTHVLIESKNIDASLDVENKTVTVKVPAVIADAYVLVKAVRNSDSKYAAKYISIKKMDDYGTFGDYIVCNENEYLNW